LAHRSLLPNHVTYFDQDPSPLKHLAEGDREFARSESGEIYAEGIDLVLCDQIDLAGEILKALAAIPYN